MSGSALTPSFLTSHRLQPCQGAGLERLPRLQPPPTRLCIPGRDASAPCSTPMPACRKSACQHCQPRVVLMHRRLDTQSAPQLWGLEPQHDTKSGNALAQGSPAACRICLTRCLGRACQVGDGVLGHHGHRARPGGLLPVLGLPGVGAGHLHLARPVPSRAPGPLAPAGRHSDSSLRLGCHLHQLRLRPAAAGVLTSACKCALELQGAIAVHVSNYLAQVEAGRAAKAGPT